MQPEIQPPIGFLTSAIADLSAETRIRVSAIGSENCSRVETNVTCSAHPGWSIGSTTGASGLAGFLSVDPVLNAKHAISHPQGWNRYAYVENSPIGHRDPTGRCTESIVCLNYGKVEAKTTVVANAPPPVTAGPMASFLDSARQGKSPAEFRAQYYAKAAAEYGKMMSGRSDYIAPSGHEMLIAMPGAMALARGAGAATATTSLFRAVAPAESDSIMATQAFTPSPSGTMFKGFFYTAEDAHSFAGMMARSTGEEYSVFGTTAPTDLVLASPAHAAAGEGAGVYIANENLGLLTPPTPVPPP